MLMSMGTGGISYLVSYVKSNLSNEDPLDSPSSTVEHINATSCVRAVLRRHSRWGNDAAGISSKYVERWQGALRFDVLVKPQDAEEGSALLLIPISNIWKSFARFTVSRSTFGISARVGSSYALQCSTRTSSCGRLQDHRARLVIIKTLARRLAPRARIPEELCWKVVTFNLIGCECAHNLQLPFHPSTVTWPRRQPMSSRLWSCQRRRMEGRRGFDRQRIEDIGLAHTIRIIHRGRST